MTLGVLFSLLVHALILSLQFGLPGAGLPSLDLPFKKQRAAPAALTVQLTQSAAAPASQQSPHEQPSQLQQTPANPSVTAGSVPVLAQNSTQSAAPAQSAPATLSWVKLAPAAAAAAKPPTALKTTKSKARPAAATSPRQKKVLAPDTQRLLTQNGWNDEGFVVAANPPTDVKADSEDLRKHYDDIQQEGVEDPDERSKRLHEIEQKRQQKLAQAQQKAQQKVQAAAVVETQMAQLADDLQRQMQEQAQQIEVQAKQAEQAAEQIRQAEAQKVQQQLQQQREQQQREQQAQALAQQQRAEAERQEQVAEQQQRQERQNLIAQKQAEQAQQRQLKEAQKARVISELKPDVQQQLQQVQQTNQQALQKLEQQVQADEQQRLASEARERASNAQASQVAQQKAAQQRADSRHDQLNSQLHQGAVSDLQSLTNQLAQAPVAVAAAKPASTNATAQGSDPLASARAVNEGGNKASGNAERGTTTGNGLSAAMSNPARPASAQDLTGSVRDQLKQLERPRSNPLVQSDEGEKRRRRSILGEPERDVPLRMYIESFKHKVERNANLNYSQLAKDRARGDPLVTVSIRSDGSVEEIIINRSSGRADLDEAVRRIVKINAKYAAFPPNVAAVYDVIEIRKVWLFEEVLRVVDEIR